MSFIDRYKKVNEIYRGSNCNVFRGVGEDNQKVILKELNSDMPTPNILARLRHEYSVLKKFNHPGIIKCLELVETASNFVLVMEDIQGVPLRKLLEKYRGDAPKVTEICLKIIDILAYLHNANIVHKDIKPDNIILNLETNNIQLIDFGLASEIFSGDTDSSNVKKVIGTLKYISPEQTGRINRSVDQRSDLYSLGVMLYEMLTGVLPFEAKSPMELIHHHMAKPVPDMREINPALPKILCDIVYKMLEKNPQYRYQTTFGLKKDLEKFKRMAAEGKLALGMQLGAEDKNSNLNISEKLYGREDELHEMIQNLEAFQGKKTALTFISGPSGIGKSALVKEFQITCSSHHGLFASGKYDQYKRNIPYVAFLECFQSIISEILTHESESVLSWKKKIIGALGINAQVIIEVVPILEKLIGEQKAVPVLPATEGQNRFQETFHKFIGVFASSENPFVLFLDDVQWADNSTIQLLKYLTVGNTYKNLFLICAYRDGQVDQSHPLMLTVKEIERQGGSIFQHRLKELRLEDTLELLNNTLGETQASKEGLAKLINDKTHGNPFFVNSFLKNLYNEKLLRFDLVKGQWDWTIDAIHKKDITSNVVDLMMSNIAKLPSSAHELVKIASCLGNSFHLLDVAEVSSGTPYDICQKLWPAVQSGLLTVLDGHSGSLELSKTVPEEIRFRFLHDRVQQAAYSMILPEDRKMLHLKIGRALIKKENFQKEYFSLAHHFNLAQEIISDEKERLHIARINFSAGTKAMDSASFNTARIFFELGIGLLPQGFWQAHFQLAMDFHINLAECEALDSEYDKSQEILKGLLQKAQSKSDVCRIYIILVAQYTTQGKYADAVESGSKALAHLNIFFPKAPKLLHAAPLLLSVKARIAVTNTATILGRDEITNENALLGLKILSNMSTAAYISGPNAMLFLCLRAVDLSLKFGNSPVSAFGYALLAFVESAKLGGIKIAREYSQMAIDMNMKFNDPVYKCKVLLAKGSFIQHMFEPIDLCFPMLEESYQAGIKSGDYNFANYGFWAILIKKYFIGRPLLEVFNQTSEFSIFTQKVDDKYTLPVLRVLKAHVARLSGIGLENGETFALDEAEFYSSQKDYRMGLAWFYIYEGVSAYYFGEISASVRQFRNAEKYVEDFLLGQVTAIDYYFFSTLTHIRALEQKLPVSRFFLRLKILGHLRKLKYFMHTSPENFKSRYLLARAQWEGHKGNFKLAETYFEQCLDYAAQRNEIQILALANECMGQMFLRQKKERYHETHIKDAYMYYMNWGAGQKTKKMLDDYPFLMKRNKLTTTTRTNTKTVESTMGFDFDIGTVLGFTKVLSTETRLEKVIGKFVELLAQNSGADRCILILQGKNEINDVIRKSQPSVHMADEAWFISSLWELASGAKIIESEPLSTTRLVPVKMMNEIVEKHQTVVCNLEAETLKYSADPYFKGQKIRSLLGLPVFHQGNLIGIVYLENSLTQNLFNSSRIDLLNILTSQASILIMNAKLLRGLENKVIARTIEINEKNIQLEHANENNKSLIRVLCHDLNNTLSVFQMTSFMGVNLGPDNIEKNKKLWGMVKSSANTQGKIIEHVKEMVALKSGKSVLTLASISLQKVFEQALLIFAEKLKNKNITLHLPEGHVEVLAEEVSLNNNVFNNILSNAIKFTPQGGRIEVKVTHEEGWVVLRISDSGIGMPEGLLADIFNSTKQTSRPGTDGEKGTGFGMPLVKTYMDFYHGKILVESRDRIAYPDGHGTTFSLYFKIPEAQTEKLSALTEKIA